MVYVFTVYVEQNGVTGKADLEVLVREPSTVMDMRVRIWYVGFLTFFTSWFCSILLKDCLCGGQSLWCNG